ncbi:hypothetical protein VNO77_19128 [Canavalia gladiata]|uniref:Uncharacterized protein n=1 Tax=Canavalia gladiata TaxID=3824 RepID=A0AAN9LMT4_CANGL
MKEPLLVASAKLEWSKVITTSLACKFERYKTPGGSGETEVNLQRRKCERSDLGGSESCSMNVLDFTMCISITFITLDLKSDVFIYLEVPQRSSSVHLHSQLLKASERSIVPQCPKDDELLLNLYASSLDPCLYETNSLLAALFLQFKRLSLSQP